jgi:hypothetical protein
VTESGLDWFKYHHDQSSSSDWLKFKVSKENINITPNTASYQYFIHHEALAAKELGKNCKFD